MGSSDRDSAVNLDYPLAFQQAFVKAIENRPDTARFRYIHVSGGLSEQDQTKTLWFMPAARKIKVFEHTDLPSQSAHCILHCRDYLKPGQLHSQTNTKQSGRLS